MRSRQGDRPGRHELDLATRPTKRTDSRARNFKGESVEVDAIPPGTLRSLTQDRIERHVDHHHLDVLQTVEAEERRLFMRMANLEFT